MAENPKPAPKRWKREEFLAAPAVVWAKALDVSIEADRFMRAIERGELTGDVRYDGEPVGRAPEPEPDDSN